MLTSTKDPLPSVSTFRNHSSSRRYLVTRALGRAKRSHIIRPALAQEKIRRRDTFYRRKCTTGLGYHKPKMTRREMTPRRSALQTATAPLLLFAVLTRPPASAAAFSPLHAHGPHGWRTTTAKSDSRLHSVDKKDDNAPRFEAFSDDIIPIMTDPNIGDIQDEKVKAFMPPVVDRVLDSYLGPRVVLAVIAAVYATNFPLGAIMNDALPASAATSARMVLASLCLTPFLFEIKPSLRLRACLCGCFTAMGYVTQSLALVDTDPARVSFLGAATVLWCPFLEWFVDKRPMGWKEAPQTWLAAILCLLGVGILELGGQSDIALLPSSITGDVLSLLQAVGFGTGVFLSAKMINEEPSQILPVTSVLIATTAFLSMLWCLADGWIGQPGWQSLALPAMFFDPSLHQVALAVLWTGVVSTSFNFGVEISALGRVPPSEASVLLASEPIWAALFAAVLLNETLELNDYLGGFCIVVACLVNALLKPAQLKVLFEQEANEK